MAFPRGSPNHVDEASGRAEVAGHVEPRQGRERRLDRLARDVIAGDPLAIALLAVVERGPDDQVVAARPLVRGMANRSLQGDGDVEQLDRAKTHDTLEGRRWRHE